MSTVTTSSPAAEKESSEQLPKRMHHQAVHYTLTSVPPHTHPIPPAALLCVQLETTDKNLSASETLLENGALSVEHGINGGKRPNNIQC